MLNQKPRIRVEPVKEGIQRLVFPQAGSEFSWAILWLSHYNIADMDATMRDPQCADMLADWKRATGRA